MKVFVTGASGFIGAHVTRALLARGHAVTALAIPEDPLWRLKDVASRFNIARGLLSDVTFLQQITSDIKPDACIHMAWYAEPGKYLHSYENISCLSGSMALLNELINAGCRRVVMAGTCSEYDTDYGYLNEDTPARPTTIYAASKLSCCLLGQQIAQQNKINFAWGRIFYPYGPQEDERRVVPAVIRALQQGQPFLATLGEQIRDYIHVEDVADAFCVLAEEQVNGIFNISSGMPITIRNLLETIGNLTGHDDLIQFGAQPYRDWEPPFICGDNRRLKEIGWLPNYTLREGLVETIEWWQKNRI